jgi:hypothetical protein
MGKSANRSQVIFIGEPWVAGTDEIIRTFSRQSADDVFMPFRTKAAPRSEVREFNVRSGLQAGNFIA